MEKPDHQSPEADAPFKDPRLSSHRMALRALTMSLLLNGEMYIDLHKSVEHLPEERQNQIQKIRKKRFSRRATKMERLRTTHEEHVHHARELVHDMNEILIKVDDVRQRFYQQIEDTQLSGFTELSDHYATRLLYLEEIGASALTTLGAAEEGVVQAHLLETLKDRIAKTRDALAEQLEWLPAMRELIFDESSQYQSIMQAAY